MKYKCRDNDIGNLYIYSDLYELLSDILYLGDFYSFIDDCYEPIDIPILGRKKLSQLIYAFTITDEALLNALMDEYIDNEAEWLADELVSNSEVSYNGYAIWAEEESDED